MRVGLWLNQPLDGILPKEAFSTFAGYLTDLGEGW